MGRFSIINLARNWNWKGGTKSWILLAGCGDDNIDMSGILGHTLNVRPWVATCPAYTKKTVKLLGISETLVAYNTVATKIELGPHCLIKNLLYNASKYTGHDSVS